MHGNLSVTGMLNFFRLTPFDFLQRLFLILHAITDQKLLLLFGSLFELVAEIEVSVEAYLSMSLLHFAVGEMFFGSCSIKGLFFFHTKIENLVTIPLIFSNICWKEIVSWISTDFPDFSR